MVLQAGARRTLETLPQRPPTPPRESETTEPRPRLLSRILSMGLGTQTPPNASPKSSAESIDTPSDRSHKKVGWSIADDPGTSLDPLSSGIRHSKQPIRPLLPSSDQKPPKSILKPYHGSIPLNRTSSLDNPAQPLTQASFAVMLESVAKQLAGADRMSRLDAYMSLSSVLKATENIPDPKALKDKMGLLAQFIQRDMTAQLPSGAPDTVLINNALILLASLLWKAEFLPHDFCVFILEHSISTFADPKVSKDVAKHLMFVVGQQNFSPKIMTSERAARLLKVTHEIDEHVQGKSIVLGRLGIYKKLLKQAKPSMIVNTDWLKGMFEDMLTNVKEVRNPVITFGSEAALHLGTQPKVSRAVVELFQAPHENGKYADYFAGRLNAMIQAKKDAACVPQIWSVVILFFHSRPAQLEQWEFMNPWFQMLQKCFNNSDPEVKCQANYAWNRLVFAIRPDEKTSPRFIKMLHQPFIGQLNRKSNGRQAKEMFQVTISSICNLLYYTMKPGASSAQLDLYWDSYVIPLIGKLSATNGEQDLKKGTPGMDGADQAVEILRSLLDYSNNSPARLWKQDRAMVPELTRIEELPSLDPKWARKNCDRILNVIEPLLEQRFADLGKIHSRARELWRSFLLSVAAAGAKEIKVSNETMACVARIFTMLRTFWQRSPRPTEKNEGVDPTAFLDSFVYLITESVNVLGILPFTEKKLSVNDQNNFAAVSTPSTHAGRFPKTIKSPIQYLVVLLVEAATNIQCSATYKAAVRHILNPFYEARTSRTSRIEFCQDLVQCLPSPAPNSNASSSETVWCVLADMLALAIGETEDGNGHTPSSSGNNKQQQGETLRNIVRVLEYGLTTVLPEAISHWEALFRAASRCIRSEVGDGGHAICLIDPLARCLYDLQGRTDIHALARLCALLVSDACYPVDAQSLEAARRRLWGPSTSSPKPSTADPYKYLYGTVGVFLGKCYEDYFRSAMGADELLSGVTVLIERCPGANLLGLFSAIGDGGGCWIQDRNGAVKSETSSSMAVAFLWDTICSKVSTTIPEIDSASLIKFQTLLCAGLNSRHKSIASPAIKLWNKTFGTRSGLEYPAEVAKALARLRFVADLKLPNFPTMFDDEVVPNRPQFVDSEDDEPLLPHHSSGVGSRAVTPFLESSPLPSNRNSKSPHPLIELPKSAAKKRISDETRATKQRGKSKRDTTPRLRHDDSQIQFAAIESSPAADTAMDSQLLTDRQREVRERQQLEASTMFPDLRSSPRPKPKKSSSKLSLSSDLPVSTAAEQEKPGTPSINHTTSTFDDFITSSPTPRRETAEGQYVAEPIVSDTEAVDIPSSPPKGSSRGTSPAEVSVTRVPEQNGPSASDEFWNVTSFGSIDSLMLGRFNGNTAPVLPQHPKGKEEVDDDADTTWEYTRQLPERGGSSFPVQAQANDNNHDQAPNEAAFVDASLSPDLGRERDELTTDEVFVDAQSSPQLELQSADLSSTQGSTKRKRRRRNRQEATVETGQTVEDIQRKGTSASSPAGVDGDSTVPLTEVSFDAASTKDEDRNNTPQLSLSLRSSEDFEPELYSRVSDSPKHDTRQSKKRRRAATSSAGEQRTPTRKVRSERSTRSSDRRIRSVHTASEEPMVLDTIPARTRSHSRRRTTASTIPETPTSAASATEAGRRRKSSHPEDDEDKFQPQPAKRRRVSRADSHVVVEDSQNAQPVADVEEDSIVVTPHHGRSKREKTATLKREEGEARQGKRRRGRSSRGSAWSEEEGEVFSSRASVDLDAEPPKDTVFVEDSFMAVVEEGKEDLGMHETGEEEGESHEVAHEDAGSATDAEAEAQIMEGMSQARSSRRVTLRPGTGDRSSTSVVAAPVTDPAAATDSDAASKAEFTGASAVSRFQELLQGLKTTTISRADAMKMEEMVWDFKAELYAAERRGRSS